MVDFMVNAILKIIMLEIIVHSNGKCILGNNNVGNNSAYTYKWKKVSSWVQEYDPLSITIK
jgi:hypothetical protein